MAPFVRDQLILVPALMVGALCLHFVWFGRGRARIVRASPRTRAAAVVAAVVAFVLAIVALHSGSAEVKIAFDSPGTMLDQALWGWGALAIGVGVLPVVIGLGMVVPSTAVPRTRALAAFASVFAASVALFTAYVAVKGTYEAAVFEPRIAERNLVYLTPLLFVALALFAATRAVRVWTLAVSAALSAWAIGAVPLNFNGLEGDAPGLAILTRLKDDYQLTPNGVREVLYGLVALSVLVGLAPILLPSAAAARSLGRRRGGAALDRLVGARRDGGGEGLERLLGAVLHEPAEAPRLDRRARPEDSRWSTSARRSPTRTVSGRWSSGTATFAGSGASTAPRRDPGLS